MYLSRDNKGRTTWHEVYGHHAGAYPHHRRGECEASHRRQNGQIRVAKDVQDLQRCIVLLCDSKNDRGKKRGWFLSLFRCEDSGDNKGRLPQKNENNSKKSRPIARTERIPIKHPPRIDSEILRKGLDRARMENGDSFNRDLDSKNDTEGKFAGYSKQAIAIAASLVLVFSMYSCGAGGCEFSYMNLNLKQLSRVTI